MLVQGQLEVNSRLGGGTRLTATIPVQRRASDDVALPAGTPASD